MFSLSTQYTGWLPVHPVSCAEGKVISRSIKYEFKKVDSRSFRILSANQYIRIKIRSFPALKERQIKAQGNAQCKFTHPNSCPTFQHCQKKYGCIGKTQKPQKGVFTKRIIFAT